MTQACYDMDYPDHKITCWVCDDGKKDDMRRMVELVGAANRGRMQVSRLQLEVLKLISLKTITRKL
jgi:cellulose synthase/poly-beta-1,6-N-acetylglucosamine synthase-like glycosyltransferase